MTKPIILAVDTDEAALQLTERLLRNRYAIDYQVVCVHSPESALQLVEAWLHAGDQIAMVLASQSMQTLPGIGFLARVCIQFPHAKRLLLFDRMDMAGAGLRLRAMVLGQIDNYVLKPSGEPDEAFHQLVTDQLVEWTGSQQVTFEMVQIVGRQWDARSHEFRDLLERNTIPFGFYDAHSDQGRALLERVQLPAGPLPVVILFSGKAFANPTPAEIADALGASAIRPHGLYDLAVIGAGPAGISAAVYGASEGLRTLVVEREAVGGQAGTSSRIRNYPGFPAGISGGLLARRAGAQAVLFGANYYLMRSAIDLHTEGHRHVVTLSDGTEVVSRTVILAMGVSYRRLDAPNLAALTGAGVYYGAALAEAPAMDGENVFVVGGGNSAGQAAVHLAKYAAQVTMLVRGETLAATMSDYLIQEIENNDKITVRLHTQVVDGWGEHRLQGLILQDATGGDVTEIAAAGLFVLIGAEPHTQWLPPSIQRNEQGYIVTGSDLSEPGQVPYGWPLARAPFLLETSIPGVFAAGDVRHRSLKRVASAVGEGSIAIHFVHQFLSEAR